MEIVTIHKTPVLNFILFFSTFWFLFFVDNVDNLVYKYFLLYFPCFLLWIILLRKICTFWRFLRWVTIFCVVCTRWGLSRRNCSYFYLLFFYLLSFLSLEGFTSWSFLPLVLLPVEPFYLLRLFTSWGFYLLRLFIRQRFWVPNLKYIIPLLWMSEFSYSARLI